MNAFGVNQQDRLVLVGYSQGGMVAAELANQLSNVSSIVTMGAPIANEQIPVGVNVISLEHANDIVPAFSGTTNPMTENWATASRHVEVKQGETVLKAHEMREYVTTSALADASTDSGLSRLRNSVLNQFQSAELETANEFAPLRAAS
jgi:pimeloyl-ACP methyl ester carboxylesterase